MTKADIANRLSGHIGLPRNEAQEIVEVIFDTLKETLIAGESVKVAGERFPQRSNRNGIERVGWGMGIFKIIVIDLITKSPESHGSL